LASELTLRAWLIVEHNTPILPTLAETPDASWEVLLGDEDSPKQRKYEEQHGVRCVAVTVTEDIRAKI